MSSRRDKLIDPDDLAVMVERSDGAGLLALGRHLMALCLMLLGALALPAPWSWLAWWSYALLLTFVFCPLHEVIHETAFRTRRLNHAVGVVFGLVLLLPPRYFRLFHLAHHRHTQDPDRDPELGSPKPCTIRQYLWHVSGIPYWTAQSRALIRNALGRTDDFVPVARRKAVMREARTFLAIYGSLAVASVMASNALLLWYWVLPALAGQPFLRWFLLAEHTGCPMVPNMLENTRTTRTNPVMQRLCWNMNLHTAHHAYAGVPFHRLPALDARLGEGRAHVADGYLRANRDIFRQLIAGDVPGYRP